MTTTHRLSILAMPLITCTLVLAGGACAAPAAGAPEDADNDPIHVVRVFTGAKDGAILPGKIRISGYVFHFEDVPDSGYSVVATADRRVSLKLPAGVEIQLGTIDPGPTEGAGNEQVVQLDPGVKVLQAESKKLEGTWPYPGIVKPVNLQRNQWVQIVTADQRLLQLEHDILQSLTWTGRWVYGGVTGSIRHQLRRVLPETDQP